MTPTDHLHSVPTSYVFKTQLSGTYCSVVSHLKKKEIYLSLVEK